MSRERRVSKLEAQSPSTEIPIIAFYEIYGIKEGTEETSRIVEKSLGPARIPVLGFDLIEPRAEESESDFMRRIHAIRVGGKLTENMNAEELAAAYAVADQELKDCSDDD